MLTILPLLGSVRNASSPHGQAIDQHEHRVRTFCGVVILANFTWFTTLAMLYIPISHLNVEAFCYLNLLQVYIFENSG